MSNKDLSFSMDDFRNGDQETFKKVYNLFYPVIHKYVITIVGHKQEADDITAETLEKLWVRHANFINHKKVEAFLYVTARNASMDYWRKIGKDKQIQNQLRLDFRINESSADEDIRPEDIAYIYDAIEHLPFKCRNVMKSIFVEGKDNPETARKLDISVQNVGFQKSKGIKKIQRQMFARANSH